MELDYLDAIASAGLAPFAARARAVFPNFTTVNESYENKLVDMKESLKSYFADETIERPFLYLVLGPPGAGKSHLMRSLVAQLNEEDTKKSTAFQAANISEVLDPRELHSFYDNIDQNNEAGTRTVTLFDEVDVRWRDGSAIKYLINPIYDGTYWTGSRFRKFGRCAFFFAGSYLQDRETLVKTQKLLAGVDLSKFLLDMYLHLRRREEPDALHDVSDALQFCYTQQKWREDVDPRTDTILYLRNLDKIRDFLSRIAGNVFEMVDVSAPLHVTREPYRISGNGAVHASPRLRATELVRLVKQREQREGRFTVFESPAQPLLEYKNVMLCERLLRVVGMIERRFKKLFPKGANEFAVERQLLNYMTVVPLINGMRSLEQLTNRLELVNGGTLVRHSGYKHEEIAMIVHNADEFADPAQVWHAMARQNALLEETMTARGVRAGDSIRVPLTSKKK